MAGELQYLSEIGAADIGKLLYIEEGPDLGKLAYECTCICRTCTIGDRAQPDIDVVVSAGNCQDADGLYTYASYDYHAGLHYCHWLWVFGGEFGWRLDIYYCEDNETWGATISDVPGGGKMFGDDTFAAHCGGPGICASLVAGISMDCATGLLQGSFTLTDADQCPGFVAWCTGSATCTIQ